MRSRQLRAETVAALTSYEILAATARHTIAVETAARVLTPHTAAAALDQWGLLPPMSAWAVELTLQVTYTGWYDTPADATVHAPAHFAGKLRWALPCADLISASGVTAIPVDIDHRHRFRVTADTTLHLTIAATGTDDAAHTAAIRLAGAVRSLDTAGLAVTTVHWSTIRGPLPHLVLRTADQPPAVRPIRPPLTARPRARRDRALADLHRLQHTIRRDTLQALLDGTLGGEFQTTAHHVDRFLRAAGLGPVPTVQRILVIADTTLRLQPADGATTADLRPPTDVTDEHRLTREADWTLGIPQPAGDGRWQIHWHLEFYLWLRPETLDTAADRVSTHLHRLLHDTDHDDPQPRIAGSAEVFDPFLDPTTD